MSQLITKFTPKSTNKREKHNKRVLLYILKDGYGQTPDLRVRHEPCKCAMILLQGANSYGQLSQGHCEDQLLPRQVKTVIGQDIERVTGGGGHTFVITKAGTLQACGSNNKGQLGLGHLTDVSELTIIPHFSSTKVTRVAAGWDFSLALTDEGQVYTFGSNAFGQLGDPTLPQKSSPPARINLPNKDHVIKVAAGLRHAVALTETGSVYCWGHAKKGQCGCNEGEIPGLKLTKPTKVQLPEMKGRLVDIVAGSYHTAAVSDAGEVLVWGCNKYGQITQNPDAVLQVNIPYIIPSEKFEGQKVKVIRSGWTHLITQTDTGNLYSWGRADYGQLGRTLPSETLSTPTPGLVDTPEKMVDFQCGSEHALFLSGSYNCLMLNHEDVSCRSVKEYSVIKIGFREDMVMPSLTLKLHPTVDDINVSHPMF